MKVFNFCGGKVNREEKYFIDLGTESVGLGLTGAGRAVETWKIR